jgi:pyruvate/2-oxoglutarate/acetoin dehydrogenase E1 component
MDNGLSILTKVDVRRSWSMHQHANFGMPGIELADDPWTIMLHLRSIRDNLPTLMNIHTCRTLWHSGTGQDGPPEWDRFAIVKKTLEELSLSEQAESVETVCREEMQALWNRKLDEQEPAVTMAGLKTSSAKKVVLEYKKLDSKAMGEKPTTADVIRELTRNHLLNNNGVAMGQCLTAVGWVGGTVPEMSQGIVELSMDDTSNTGIAVGYALAHSRYPEKYGRPIQIVRYQGFEWFLGTFLANYAAKSKDMWGVACPIFHRAVAMEGAIGPVAGSSHHGMIMRMPGIRIAAPMTPGEYLEVWDDFLKHDDPYYVSEHRRSFPINCEMPHIIHEKADITLIGISAARLNAIDAVKELEKGGIICNLIHQVWLKPFFTKINIYQTLFNSFYGGIVLDTDFENSVGKCIAHDLMLRTLKPVRVLGLEERAAGFAPHLDNLPATPEQIIRLVKQIVRK